MRGWEKEKRHASGAGSGSSEERQQDMNSAKESDGAEQRLSPNLPPWKTEYSKLKEFEKRAGAGRSL